MKSIHCLFVLGIVASINSCAQAVNTDTANAGLKLPKGFTAIKVAEGLGAARHISVASNGDIFVKLEKLKDGKGIYLLHDADNNGSAEQQFGFGNYVGTGIYLKDGYLYASSNQDVFRYKLGADNKPLDPDNPEKIVSGLIERNEHESKSIVLDNDGNVYVNIGAYSNSCQQDDRATGSMGIKPCPILDSAAGIWQFKIDKQNQTYGDGVHYATGLRNVVGLDWNTQTNSLFVMQHGRDQLHDIFPAMYTTKQSADLPAECMYELHNGSNGGWPYMYYDQIQHKKVLAPEYGGDGRKAYTGNAQDPVVAFPGHMAPNGLLFYTGNMFPERYKNGAFIAFHGSWNRAPEPQKGYFVAFVPFKDGKPSGDWEIFADNFSGGPAFMQPSKAKHRPCGLAQGPDGSLYVSDDAGGTIYRIMYNAK
jgi:glucose/arabinose dehydrogenase